MGRSPSNEQTALLPHQLSSKPLKFPLGLVSEGVRPYLELIRLEKVSSDVRRHFILQAHQFLVTVAHRNYSYVLAIWSVHLRCRDRYYG
jgi:hypothetical protein